MKRNFQSFFSMGLPLLVTVLLVLLLVTFSLLSLSAARSDRQRAELLMEHRREYYEANNRAEEVLARLVSGEAPGVTVTREDGKLSYEIPVNQEQSLFVTLGEEDLKILRWQTGER